MTLIAEDISFSYARRQTLFGVSLSAHPHRVLGLLGPNGSGKSTLTKVLARIGKASGGRVLHDGEDLATRSRAELARLISYVPQSTPQSFELSVRDSVMLGRTPHYGLRPTARDQEAVDRALADLDLLELEGQKTTELSGGQLQRVSIARALAQDTSVLLLDEPTSALDLRHQVETLELLRRRARSGRLTVVIAIHDLNLAARYCDDIAFLKEGRLVGIGERSAVLTAEAIEAVYGLPVHLDQIGDRITISPRTVDF